mgnify:CR=1 FL=1
MWTGSGYSLADLSDVVLDHLPAALVVLRRPILPHPVHIGLDLCELEVLEPRFSDDFILKLLYEIINKRTSQRVKLPEGVFDMTTAIHGIYE